MSITLGGYNLQPSNKSIIVSEIEYRSASQFIESDRVSRLFGTKLTNAQLDQKSITIRGSLFADTKAGLDSLVDEFLKNTVVKEASLEVQAGRTYIVTTRNVNIPDRSYTQTYVNFTIDLINNRGYSVGPQVSATAVIPSGTQSSTLTTTISGIISVRPIISINLDGSGGVSPINRVDLTRQTTGSVVTVSGVYNRGSSILINYDNFTITNSGNIIDYVGSLEDFEAGSNSIDVSLSGTAPQEGSSLEITYNPRYY